jgi:hypothetical protein
MDSYNIIEGVRLVPIQNYHTKTMMAPTATNSRIIMDR